MGKYSELLYARPTFLSGLARILDFGGTLNVYNTSKSAADADQEALLSDWYAVGDDIRDAIIEYQEVMSRSREGVGRV